MMPTCCPSLLLFFLFFQQNPSASPSIEHNFRIAGVVVDASGGQPLGNAQVFIGAAGVANSGQSVTTADDGRFAFENLAPGHYALSARRKGYLNQAYKQHETFSTAIIVGPDLDTSNLRFEMHAEASISGQVVDEAGDPVRNAQVLLFKEGVQNGEHRRAQQRSEQSDDLGHYHFGHLEPGAYFVAVSAQPWYAQQINRHRQWRTNSDGQRIPQNVSSEEAAFDVVYPVTFFSNARDISGAAPITLRSGDVQTVDFSLQPIPALHVTVRAPFLGEGGSVWPQVSQVVEGAQQGLPVSIQQREPGIFEIAGLPPGRVNLGLHFQKGNQSSIESQILQLAQDTEINLTEAPVAAAVSGVAKMEDGSPLPQMRIQLHRTLTGESVGMQIERNGEFASKYQKLSPGEYEVFLVGQSGMIKSITASGARVSGHTIEITGGEDVKLTVLVAKGSGRITGVALKEGKPLDGVMVVLVPQSSEHDLRLFRRDQSDSDGSFNLPNVLPGKYTVVAIENGWDLDWFTPGVLESYLAGGEAVDVTPDAKLDVKVKVQ